MYTAALSKAKKRMPAETAIINRLKAINSSIDTLSTDFELDTEQPTALWPQICKLVSAKLPTTRLHMGQLFVKL